MKKHLLSIFVLVAGLGLIFLLMRPDKLNPENGLPRVGGTQASLKDGNSKGEGAKPPASGNGQGAAVPKTLDAGAVRSGSIADIIEGADLLNPDERERVVEAVREIEKQHRERGLEAARKMGIPERTVFPDGRVQEVAGVDPRGRPVYFTTHNANAAISSGAKPLNASPYSLSGTSLLAVGVWDGGAGRTTHQEFGSRVVSLDGAEFIDHATHVIGTIASGGVVANSKGAGAAIPVRSYDWNSDRSEMLGSGAGNATAAIGNTAKFLVSNHSYGYISGWNYVGGGSPFRAWEWWGDEGGASATGSDFGMYNTYARDADSLAAGLPYFLMVRSAGNDRSDNPGVGQAVALFPGSEDVLPYNPSIHPAGDGSYQGGYDTMSFDSLAKNVITVGSAADAVNGGVRDSSRANVSSFSCFGPVDDGRIKPDVVANGESLYSTTSTSDISYGASSGTSMAAPGVAGLAMLLAEDFVDRYGYAMRASTLKGLLIHTADDRGNAGPDYRYGWGLVNGVEASDLIRDNYDTPEKNRLVEDSMARFGGTKTYALRWDEVSPLKVTLSWTDPAGTATTVHDSRVSRLRHNLNVRIISPGGDSYYPYVMPFVGTWTQESMTQVATTGINNTDNVEQVLVSSPVQEGVWTVEVTRGNSFSSDQAYSLLVSGSTFKEEAIVTLSDLFHVYDGTSKSFSVETDPVGLAVVGTYDGESNSPVNAGSYQVVATVVSSAYMGSAEGVMEIRRADQTINFPPFTGKTYGEDSFQAGASSSSGLPISYSSADPTVATVSADGVVTITGVGETQITASQAGDSNHNAGEASQSLYINTADATVNISGLEATYDRNPKPVSVTTNPPGLTVTVTYDGSSEVPVSPGTYFVYCEIQDDNYQGDSSAFLTIIDAVNGVTYEQWRISSLGEAELEFSEQDDPDRDGVPNLAEFHLGTNPLDPDSRLGVNIVTLGETHSTVRFSPLAERGAFYLESWTELGVAPSAQGVVFTPEEVVAGEAERDIPKVGPKGYYRLLYSPPY